MFIDSNPFRQTDPAIQDLALREARKQVEQSRVTVSEK
jgi:hypothetical protein